LFPYGFRRWISIPFLRNEESGTTLLEIATAKELAVRDGEKSEIRLEMTLENLIEVMFLIMNSALL
jgi:hypothetical protein